MGAGSREMLACGEEGSGCWKPCCPLKWQSGISLLPGHPKGKLFLQGFIRPIFILFYFISIEQKNQEIHQCEED